MSYADTCRDRGHYWADHQVSKKFEMPHYTLLLSFSTHLIGGAGEDVAARLGVVVAGDNAGAGDFFDFKIACLLYLL